VEPVAGRAGTDLDRGFLELVLKRYLRVGQQPRELEQQAPGHNDRSLHLDLRLERRTQRKLHVGRRKLEPPLGGTQQDPREDLNGRSGRDAARDDPECTRELVTRASDPESSLCNHSFSFHHL
jgi:hypothetical protein